MVDFKITARNIYQELQARGVETEVIDAEAGLLRYRKGGQWHIVRSSTPDTSSFTGGFMSDRKPLAYAIAQSEGVPIPRTCVVDVGEDAPAYDLLKTCSPLVVKPSDGAHGDGVTVGVTTAQQLKVAIQQAKAATQKGKVVVQQQVNGDDMRVLIIGGRVVAAAHRLPAKVIGDGKRTIRELIEYENTTDPDRGYNYEKKLNKIDLPAAERFLGERLDSEVPSNGERVQVVGTANIGTGGEAHDVTDDVQASPLAGYAEQLAQAFRLDVCGVDFLWDKPKGELYFIEINACPSFGLHLMPVQGRPRNVAKDFVDFLLQN
jgi:cyanophycin synthetase